MQVQSRSATRGDPNWRRKLHSCLQTITSNHGTANGCRLWCYQISTWAKAKRPPISATVLYRIWGPLRTKVRYCHRPSVSRMKRVLILSHSFLGYGINWHRPPFNSSTTQIQHLSSFLSFSNSLRNGKAKWTNCLLWQSPSKLLASVEVRWLHRASLYCFGCCDLPRLYQIYRSL